MNKSSPHQSNRNRPNLNCTNGNLTNWHQTIWRWHFYAALFVIPFILILAVTGSIYLFKPQLDRWQESEWTNLSVHNSIPIEQQLDNVQSNYPDASFHHYRMPVDRDDASVFHIGLSNDWGMRDVYVSPQGEILAAVNPEDRISNFVAKIHGTLLLGDWGRYLVEIAASWAIIMIISGLYLWWPNGAKIAGLLWPRLNMGKKIFWRDIHAVTGFWVSGLALILLFSGLPWTQLWSSNFNLVRAEMGWTNEKAQDWSSGAKIMPSASIDLHIEHDHELMIQKNVNGQGSKISNTAGISLTNLSVMARSENLPHPVIIAPENPIDHSNEGIALNSAAKWKISSETQDRPLRRSLMIDAETGRILDRSGFSDRHLIDKIISYGIAWHEGQLLGIFNQFVGVLTAIALIILCISGVKMWWRRRSIQGFIIGAPPAVIENIKFRYIVAAVLLLLILLPMAGISLVIVALGDMLVNRLIKSNKSVSR